MSYLSIEGGAPLHGELTIQGSKNSVLPVLAATILARDVCRIENCPRLRDVDASVAILRHLGCRVRRDGTALEVDTAPMARCDIPDELMREMRSSIIFLGAILARQGEAVLSYPGGCELGPRPIDLHLAALRELVDVEAIRGANLRVVCDPLYGAGRHYLADLLRDMGVEVVEIHNAEDPTFAGLHPEPIQPWVDEGLAKVGELGYDALFINDGDADRIAAGDSRGNYVNAHRIITLLTKHMVDRGETGRVVSTVTASAMLDRMCRKLGLELVSTPVGFKWIYAEMQKGGVLLGGEESGGIGLPDHVKERDGLLMALLLTECMAQSGKDLGTIVDEMLADIGRLEFARCGLSITDEQMARFRAETVPTYTADEIAGKRVLDVDRRDGVKLLLEGDAWVMMRPSGTEPLVRIYAEAATTDEVNELLDAAEAVVTSL